MWNNFRSGSMLSMNLCHMMITIAGSGWSEPGADSGLADRNAGCLRLVSIDSTEGSDTNSISDAPFIAFENGVSVEI
jgi:hypothetical protein